MVSPLTNSRLTVAFRKPDEPQGSPDLQIEKQKPPVADRILIVRLGAMGDVIRTLPAVAALRTLYPGAHLTWLVEKDAAGVVEAAGFVDETLIFPRGELSAFIRAADGFSFARCLREVIRRLRDRRFDMSLDFHGILKSGLLARLSGAPLRYAYGPGMAREFSDQFANRHVNLPNPHVSRFERNAAMVRALSIDAKIPERPSFLNPSPLGVERLAARLRVSQREKAAGFVLIHAGSSRHASHKRYAPSAWSEVAKRLAADGIEVWIASGAGRRERNLAEEILKGSDGAIVRAPETRSFDDLLALLVRASVFVSCDSGPLHAASLLGVPVVQILGPTDPVHNEPWAGSSSGRVHTPIPCSPCRHGCADPACMRAIPPALVVEEIHKQNRLSKAKEGRSVDQSQ